MKYVNTDKLIKSVNNYQVGAKAALNPTDGDADYYKGKIDACKDIQDLIDSLQQEQPKMNIPSAGSGAMGTTPPKFKLDVKQYPPDVDLEKEIDNYIAFNFSEAADGILLSDANSTELQITDVSQMARHFYELGLNARKED